MIEDRLSSSLIDMSFRRINSNAEGIYLFYQLKNGEAYIVSIIHTPEGGEFSPIQYEHILGQMKDSFLRGGNHEVHLLSLVFTSNPEKAKQLCQEGEDNHWIINPATNQLIIYETQASDFLGLRDIIEKLLMEELVPNGQRDGQEYLSNQAESEWSPLKVREAVKKRWLSPVNTILIGVNVLAFLLMQYTNLFGGTKEMMAKGALSWVLIKEYKEYYRILTSMFMHSGWRHLVNNMLVLFFVGDNLERAAGKTRYLIIFFGAGVIAGISSVSYNMVMDHVVYSIGASGAILGVVGAMLYILIVNKGRLENISSHQMFLFAIFSLYGGISNASIDQAAHIGGFAAGLLLAMLIYRKPKQESLA
jgi:rhomboid protease GluP